MCPLPEHYMPINILVLLIDQIEFKINWYNYLNSVKIKVHTNKYWPKRPLYGRIKNFILKFGVPNAWHSGNLVYPNILTLSLKKILSGDLNKANPQKIFRNFKEKTLFNFSALFVWQSKSRLSSL